MPCMGKWRRGAPFGREEGGNFFSAAAEKYKCALSISDELLIENYFLVKFCVKEMCFLEEHRTASGNLCVWFGRLMRVSSPSVARVQALGFVSVGKQP